MRTDAGSSRPQFDASEEALWTVTAAATPDASDTTAGKVRLAGDLGGTAATPEVFRTVQSGIRIARVFRGSGAPPATIQGAVTGDVYEDRSTTPPTIYDITVS